MSIYNEYISLFCCLLDVNIRVKIEMEVVLMKRLGEELVKIIGFAIVACFVMLLVPSISLADNPIVQNLYTADPAPMVYNGRMYVYTSHDEDNSTNYTMNDWKCYSTTDMVNWTDHGTVMSYQDFSWARENSAWAGQCIEKNGKFYYYVPLKDKSDNANVIGVAVGDSPMGPFTDPIGKPLVKGGWGNIDPTVFIDDDGQAYMYWGNPNLRAVKLKDNMIETEGEIKEWKLTGDDLSEDYIKDMQAQFGVTNNPDRRPTLYEEGPWFYKRGDLYYMVFAGNGIPERVDYSTSTNPMGPWTYRGMIMNSSYNGKGSGSFTNHPGVIDYRGHSYFFYHTGKLPGGSGFTRSVAVEEFSYNADGTFPEIPFTDEGVHAIENLNPYQRIEAETHAWGNGLESEVCTQGGMNLCAIENGDNLKVKNVDFGFTGAEEFTASVACGTEADSTIEIRLDSQDGTLIGKVPVSSTGGWEQYKEVTVNVTNVQGIHDVYMIFKGSQEGALFKFDYWRFSNNLDGEIVANGGFENGLESWEAHESGELSLGYSTIHSGSRSLKVTNRSKTSSGAIQDITGKLQNGKTYTVKGAVRFPSSENTEATGETTL